MSREEPGVSRRTSPRRRTDLLAHEFTHDRLSAAALGAGRALEDVFAAAQRSPGAPWSERVDVSPTGDAGAAAAVEAARRVVRALARVERLVGPVDARLVRRILGDRLDYGQAAALDGRIGTRAVSYCAQRFRDALEELGRASGAVGSVPPKVNDRYSSAAAIDA